MNFLATILSLLLMFLVLVPTQLAWVSAGWAQKAARDGAAPGKAPQKAAPHNRPLFAPPPRTIADITAFLDQEKPDAAKRAKTEAEAEAEPAADAGREALKNFYFRRAQARTSLGRLAGAIADCEQAIAHSDDYVNDGSRIELYLEGLTRQSGDYTGAISVLERIAKKLDLANRNKGRAFAINMAMTRNLLFLGQVDRAEGYVRKSQVLMAEARSWPKGQPYLSAWEANVEESRGLVLGARGRFADAAGAYHKAVALYKDAQAKCPGWPVRVRCDFEGRIYYATIFAASSKASDGRLSEAEIDVRQALLGRLKTVGKFHADIANGLTTFSWVLHNQARHAETEAIARASIEIFDAIGYSKSAAPYVSAQSNLASALFNLQRYDEVKDLFQAMERATQSWPAERRTFVRFGNWSRIYAHYFTGDVEKGIEIARESLAWYRARLGEKHVNTATSRAHLATGLTFAGRDAEALAEFEASIPVLLSRAGSEDDEDPASISQAYRRLQSVVEANILLLARSALPDRAEQSLRLADAVRTRSVQNALAAAAARAAARSPVLAELARKEQDLDKQIQGQAALISNVLAEPPEQRQGTVLKDLQQELARLRVERQAARSDIARRFPEYTNLIRPPPASAEDIRAVLKPDEALISFYFGLRDSFVWAMTKTGPVAMAKLPTRAKELNRRIQELRAALAPDASSLSDIPDFDVAAAHQLYRLLLAPVEDTWRPAKTLIVVTNGALGQLPISLLPTEPVAANDRRDGESYFAWYRRVPWLARTHAVVSLPSASALRTLRTAVAATRKRQSFIGFGDPLFTAEQATRQEEVDRSATADTRGARIKLRATPRLDPTRNAGLEMLPRLPDTAAELTAIAGSLHADPAKALYLGKAANENTVTSLDLTQYRIVAFATHGLVPGDLDGLTQPALALTAPSVAQIDGDGLLTAEEILQLKLDADWVVLSACNTGAAQGAGAEAVSGLGRAFFYAGSRALLVTNWPVHSESARELVTDVFRRQATSPGLSRAEALRQAMMALLDGGEAKDKEGNTLFTYGHPLFWAPYSIVGDGGSL